jgi:hypothetical protein
MKAIVQDRSGLPDVVEFREIERPTPRMRMYSFAFAPHRSWRVDGFECGPDTGEALPKVGVLPGGLQLPGADDRVFDGICVARIEISNDHHVLPEAHRHGKRLWERLQ